MGSKATRLSTGKCVRACVHSSQSIAQDKLQRKWWNTTRPRCQQCRINMGEVRYSIRTSGGWQATVPLPSLKQEWPLPTVHLMSDVPISSESKYMGYFSYILEIKGVNFQANSRRSALIKTWPLSSNWHRLRNVLKLKLVTLTSSLKLTKALAFEHNLFSTRTSPTNKSQKPLSPHASSKAPDSRL